MIAQRQYFYLRINGAERRSGRNPGARVLFPLGDLRTSRKGKH